MSDFLFILAILVIAIVAVIFSVLYIRREDRKHQQEKSADGGTALGLIKQDLEAIKSELKESREKNISFIERQLDESRSSTERQIKESRQIVQEVTERLTRLDETNKQVMGFAEQLQSLENILQNPKQRGNLGEYALELLLEKSFTPHQYARQYGFKNGEKVDFAIFIGDKVLPVDSKFSLENYNRIVNEKDKSKHEQLEKTFKQDLKNRIDETAKYIRPDENTFDFALMFIPAEGIYYDLIINEVGSIKSNTRDLIDYAAAKKVSIVSPNSFYAMLRMILEGLRAFQIEKSALDIRKNVEKLGQHLIQYDQYMKKLGSNLMTAVNAFNDSQKELGKIDKDVVKITGGEQQIEPLKIDRPSVD